MLAAGADALRWEFVGVTIRGWALRGPTGVAVPGGGQIGVGAGAVPIIAPREERHGRPCDARLLNDVALPTAMGCMVWLAWVFTQCKCPRGQSCEGSPRRLSGLP
jgi:hypothetical protein